MVDCRGRPCPVPVVELARALLAVAPGEVVEVVSDDPAARLDVPAFCRMRGHDYLGRGPPRRRHRPAGPAGRMSRSRAAGVPVVAVGLALVLGGGLTAVGVRRDEPAGAAPVAAPAPQVLAALEERIRPLGGTARRLDDAQNGLGPLTADRVLALAGGSEQDRAAAARGLELLGFEQALGRGWRGDGRMFVVVAYRFATPEGATGWWRGCARACPARPSAARRCRPPRRTRGAHRAATSSTRPSPAARTSTS